jgi:AcrR family transcriptional regulator
MGLTERRTREKAARREAILEAAKAVFAEKGLRAATMDDIAERAELGKGTLYLHFRSKEDVYAALMQAGLARVAERFRAAIDPAGPADENLRRILRAYYQFYQEEPDYFRLLYFASHADVSAKTGVDFGAPEGRECLKVVAGVIQQGIDQGVFSPLVNPREAAALGWAATNGVLIVFEDPGPAKELGLQVEEMLRKLTELLIRGLRNPG